MRICDPACGSGHMLTYAFDLLHAIYEEEGYDPTEIPRLILTQNLYGIEIDERAGSLAAFALAMKAREKDRRFFQRGVRPNICVLQPVTFQEGELDGEPWIQGLEVELREPMLRDLLRFREVDNVGSLLRPELTLGQVRAALRNLVDEGKSGDLFVRDRHGRIERVLEQTEYLVRKYHVVVSNPPYLGGKALNPRMKKFAVDEYKKSKSDLFAMFIERGLQIARRKGYNSMVTMESWMFLSSYARLRSNLLNESTILCMVHMPYLGKGGNANRDQFWHCGDCVSKDELPGVQRGLFVCPLLRN